MDIFLYVNQNTNKKELEKFDGLLKEISPDHHRNPGIGSDYFHLWRQESGESVYIETEAVEIWFDGYVHSTNPAELSQFLLLLARRIIESGVILQGEESGIFNIVIREKITGKLYIANDPGGLFPLYYGLINNSVFISSHLFLVAKVLDLAPNLLQVAINELFGYPFGEGTFFEGMKQLLPGELITIDPDKVSFNSKYPEVFYSETQEYGPELAEILHDALFAPVRQVAKKHINIGVMLSEGFDSRLIAAMFCKSTAQVYSFTHGTNGTFGARISEEVGKRLGLFYHFENVLFPTDPAALRRQLFLADNLHISFWCWGTQYFRSSPAEVVTAGTALDSTLGGHIFYIPSSDRSRAVFQRYQEIIRQNLNLIQDDYVESLSIELLENFLNFDEARLSRRIHSRFVPDVADQIDRQIEKIRDFLQLELKRVEQSGSPTKTLQLQRFFLENRARKFSFGQELTIRTDNKIAIPSYERAFLKVASRVPTRHKLQHGVYLQLLRRYFPQAAAIPTGNFSLPATYPRVLLETSRFSGKMNDIKILRSYLESRGHSSYSSYRGALFSDLNGREPNVYKYFSDFFIRNSTVLNTRFYHEYLQSIRNFQARVFNYDEFYRAIEYSQVFQHSF